MEVQKFKKMAEVKVGNRVRFLNAIGEGIVRKIEGKIAYVEDEEGFITPTMLKECVVVVDKKTQTIASGLEFKEDTQQKQNDSKPALQPEIELEPYEETEEGEKISLILSFEPHNLKDLNKTSWDTYIINDSNYWLSLTYLWMEEGSDDWTLKHLTNLEPGTELFAGVLLPSELSAISKIGVQYIAYKEEKKFRLKKPLFAEVKLDATKFFKLHCYSPNIYFENPVITIDLVKEDRIQHMRREINVKTIEEGMKQKKEADLKSLERRRMVRKFTGEQNPMAPLIVDLHIDELVENTRGLTPADMLNRQIDDFRDIMDANLKYKGKKLVFIHGKGEGVLKNALLKELNHRYKGHQVQDASFRDYGFGATQVII